MTSTQIAIILILVAALFAALVIQIQKRRDEDYREHQAWLDERDAHIKAVRAQCTVSPAWALMLLAPYEAELTELLELGLELDDQSPKPTPYDD